MTIFMLLLFATCFLAYANGANDNFKGVATLFGSQTMSYRRALWLATGTTFAGSIAALIVAVYIQDGLVRAFSGKGLVSSSLINTPEFLLAVALGAGITVILATVTGFPISTTHGLVGSLVGAGLVAEGTRVRLWVLSETFVLPLLTTPVLAIVIAALAYVGFRTLRIRFGITKEMCVCVGERESVVPIPLPVQVLGCSQEAVAARLTLTAAVEAEAKCEQRYVGAFLGFNCQQALDFGHTLSASAVCFARGLNDTPKIVGLLIAARVMGIEWGFLAVTLGIALGGMLNARKVAATMSQRITPLNHGQGFTANLTTSLVVILASLLQSPVSTTHVSVGSLLGIGFVTGEANWGVVRNIVLSWVLTLPLAAVASGFIYYLLSR